MKQIIMKQNAGLKRSKTALEAIESVLKELNEKADEGGTSYNSVLIIVEGRRDVASLRNLGIRDEIEISACANRPTAEFCEKIAEAQKKAVILTDWDRKGGILAARLEEHFKNLGIPYETAQREKLLFYTKKDIKDVESLHAHVLKLRKTVYGTDECGIFEPENEI